VTPYCDIELLAGLLAQRKKPSLRMAYFVHDSFVRLQI
jgi:hypothetical protein